ncbi:TPA: hypothetical protein ENS27_16920 [bacterium]|nr:hypothetical protein [bacterium]
MIRALLIGLFFVPIHSYLIVKLEIILYRGGTSASPIFWTTIYNLLFLIAINAILVKFLPKIRLTQQELLTIYLMTNISTCLIGHDMLQILVPMMGHAFWFATPENEWQDLFWQYIPKWLTVDDKKVLQGYYYGDSSLYKPENLLTWIKPVLWWCGFICVLVFVMTCLNLIFRKQWTEEEKLSYPIIQLPLQMTNPATRFFRNKAMWAGFALIGLINCLNGLHVIFPPVPFIPYWAQNYSYLITEKPWNAISFLFIGLNAEMVVLGFLIPEDLCFSLWFFHWFWKAQQIFGSAMGWRSLPSFPYGREQASGAYIAIAIILLYINRRHLINVIKHLLGIVKIDDRLEPMSYRYSALGVFVGFVLICIFCYYGGMSIWVTVPFFALYFLIQLAVTRMRAELGTPVHDLHYSGPDEIIVRSVGTRKLDNGTLTMFSLFWFINRAYRSNIMAHEMEGFKMAERTKTNYKTIFLALILTTIIGSFTAFWAMLHQGYETGMQIKAPFPAIGAFGSEPWNRLQSWVNNRTNADIPGTLFMYGGFIFTIFLAIMRVKFIWWIFHPAGYAVSNSYNMEVFWSPLFFGWLAKTIILKFGGLKLYRKAVPFFLGVMLGHFITSGTWTVIGIILNYPI